MKNILLTIVVTILFFFSGMVFWAGLSPKSFHNFFEGYPLVNKTINKVNILGPDNGEYLITGSSELISSNNGEVTIRGNSWLVEVARTVDERELGLSNRRTLYPKRGMLFVFERPITQNFWMKDMLIPLDMIFFDENWKIILIEKEIRPNTYPKTFGSTVKSKYVLEINAGEAESFNLQVGDRGIFTNK